MADEPSRESGQFILNSLFVIRHSPFAIRYSLFAIPTSVPHPSLRDGRGTRARFECAD